MYYIYLDTDNKHKIKEISNVLVTDATYRKLKYGAYDKKYDIQGQFGRLDYAQAWTDFKNGLINRKELYKKLNIK